MALKLGLYLAYGVRAADPCKFQKLCCKYPSSFPHSLIEDCRWHCNFCRFLQSSECARRSSPCGRAFRCISFCQVRLGAPYIGACQDLPSRPLALHPKGSLPYNAVVLQLELKAIVVGHVQAVIGNPNCCILSSTILLTVHIGVTKLDLWRSQSPYACVLGACSIGAQQVGSCLHLLSATFISTQRLQQMHLCLVCRKRGSKSDSLDQR